MNRSTSPEYFRGVHPWSPSEFAHPSRDYEYVGVPLEPPPLPHNYDPDDEESGPSTAEIIANQSQDYIDEKLAEYQMTIYQLQGKQDSLHAPFRLEDVICDSMIPPLGLIIQEVTYLICLSLRASFIINP